MLDFEEAKLYLMEREVEDCKDPEQIEIAFKEIDTDENGYISKDELFKWFSNRYAVNPAHIEKTLRKSG